MRDTQEILRGFRRRLHDLNSSFTTLKEATAAFRSFHEKASIAKSEAYDAQCKLERLMADPPSIPTLSLLPILKEAISIFERKGHYAQSTEEALRVALKAMNAEGARHDDAKSALLEWIEANPGNAESVLSLLDGSLGDEASDTRHIPPPNTPFKQGTSLTPKDLTAREFPEEAHYFGG